MQLIILNFRSKTPLQLCREEHRRRIQTWLDNGKAGDLVLYDFIYKAWFYFKKPDFIHFYKKKTFAKNVFINQSYLLNCVNKNLLK